MGSKLKLLYYLNKKFDGTFSTIALIIPGFFKICCPRSVLNGNAESRWKKNQYSSRISFKIWTFYSKFHLKTILQTEPK